VGGALLDSGYGAATTVRVGAFSYRVSDTLVFAPAAVAQMDDDMMSSPMSGASASASTMPSASASASLMSSASAFLQARCPARARWAMR
jgi:hypothetical protein